MWLARNSGRESESEGAAAEVGRVCLAGKQLAVQLGSEKRHVSQFSPYGYFCRPNMAVEVLSLPVGGKAETALIGVRQGMTEVKLEAGEVYLSVCAGSGIHLRADGRIDIEGDVFCNGERFEPPSSGGEPV